MSKKQPKKRNKAYNPKATMRMVADKHAKQFIICGVNNMGDDGVHVLRRGVPVRLRTSDADMINRFKHKWQVCYGVFGRYKNGKVWVRYEIADVNLICTAEELSPLLSERVNEYYARFDKNTKLSSFWLAIPDHRQMSLGEVMLPLYYSCAWFAFLNKVEHEAGVERGNHVPEGVDYRGFLEWFNANVSGHSEIKQLDVEEELAMLGEL